MWRNSPHCPAMAAIEFERQMPVGRLHLSRAQGCRGGGRGYGRVTAPSASATTISITTSQRARRAARLHRGTGLRGWSLWRPLAPALSPSESPWRARRSRMARGRRGEGVRRRRLPRARSAPAGGAAPGRWHGDSQSGFRRAPRHVGRASSRCAAAPSGQGS